MNLEKKNEYKRKNEPLTYSEWLSFFFLPYKISSNFFPAEDANDAEMIRFQKYGFERKVKDAHQAKLYGKIFYVLMIILFVFIIRS